MSSSPAARLRVLLVEDDAAVRLTLAANLELDGVDVVEAEDARSALEHVAGGASFDVVLSDVRMPGMSGVELAVRIRAIQGDLPIVLMTAFSDDQQIRDGISHGVFTVVSKPFDVEHVSRLLRRAADRPKVLVVDDQRAYADSLASALRAVGLDASAVFDGGSAIAAVERGGFDVCVTDLEMPGIDGAEVVARIRGIDGRVRCIAFSGYDAPATMRRVAASGVAACLRKPLDVSYLVELIALARARPDAA